MNNAINLFFISITTSVIVCASLVFCLKKREQKFILRERIDLCNTCKLPEYANHIFKDIANRTYVFYYSFLFHNLASLVCYSFSLIFTITGFILLAISQEGDCKYIISLLAIIFLIVTIFVKPHKYRAQYLSAYRELDILTLSTMQELSSILDTKETYYKTITEVISKKASVENSLSLEAE